VKNRIFFLILIFFGLTIGVASDIYVPVLYKNFFDLISGGGTMLDQAKSILIQISIFYFVMWLAWRVNSFMISYFESRIINEIYNDCFDYLHKHSYKFFANSFAGSLVRKVSRCARSFETLSDKYFFDLYPLLLRIVVSCIIVFLTNHTLGFIFIGWIVGFLTINYFAILYKLPYDLIRSESDSKLSGVLADTITNNINIKLFSRHDYEYNSFREVTLDNMVKSKKEWDISNVIDGIQGALILILELVILFVALKYIKNGMMSIGTLVMIQTYFFQLADRLWGFGRYIREIYRALADSEEMIEILHTEHEIKDIDNAKALRVKKGIIEFENLSFSYNKKQKIFKDFSLKIKAGEKVAIVGDSGGGKSSLIKLLFRFYDIDSGRILIDGQDIKNVSQDSLRSLISLVPQDPILFHRTLFDNIKYGKIDASKDEVVKASKLAHAYDFVERLPDSYDTYVGERGIKLSGGERQRVAIARAILKNSPILVLDEATSSLDSKSEKMIQKALKNLFSDKTVIVIAHRLSTIMEMDRIVVLKDGIIREEGSHKELLKAGGYYYELWNTQVSGFIDSE
jgi:ATP-binding cassette subfamily B protein